MMSAKSLASLTLALITLIFSVVLPLSAYAATEVNISSSGNSSVTINGKTYDTHNSGTSVSNTIHISTDDESETPTPKPTMGDTPSAGSAGSLTEKTPTPTPTRTFFRLRRTPTPTPTRTPTPTPTRTPTPTKTSTPTPTTSVSGASDEKQAYIMNAINDYRKSQGLSPVKTDPYTCSFAKTRAQEITKSFTHDGFSTRIANDTLPYPSFHQVTENIAMTSDYKRVVTLWINSSGHAANMRRDTPYVCVESSGNYYAYEGWRP